MRHALSAAAFVGTNVLLAPITLAGYAVWLGNMMVGDRSGVSLTAQGPLSTRFIEHRLGTRSDEAASRLMLALPGVPRIGVQLTLGPLFLAHALSGYVPRAFRYPFEGEVRPVDEVPARTSLFDAAVDRFLAEHDQLVVLGAGFDTRAFRSRAEARIRAFEVDRATTQAAKRAALARAGIDAAGVTFVEADFEKQDWLDRLVANGFDRLRPALFLWEGVTMYLDRPAIDATLRSIAATAKGSAVAFDYFTTEALTSRSPYWRYARAATKRAREPLRFGVEATPPLRDRVVALVESNGLSLVDHAMFGREGEGERAWGGFAVARVG